MLSSSAVVTWRQGPALVSDRPRTLAGLCAAAAIQAQGRIVFTDETGRTWTWDQLLVASGRLAYAWSQQVRAGDRIAILVGNGWAHLLAELAAWRLGAIAAPLAAIWGDATCAELLARLEPALVVRSEAAVAAHGDQGPEAPWYPAVPHTDCLILFTSGSTGAARGVVLSHDNLCSQQAAFAQLWPDFGRGDRVAGYLPWHHSFGALAERLWVLTRGAHFFTVPGGGRDRDAFLRTLATVRPTVFCSVPKLHAIAVAAGLPPAGLRWAFSAGAPLSAHVAQAYAARGIPVVEGWGLTESGPSATITPRERPWAPGIVGDPIPGVAVGIDAQQRVLIRGPGVMQRYWRDPVATKLCRVDAAGNDAAGNDGAVLISGDLGRWTSMGLALHGRDDQQVKLANGEKIPVTVLESRFAALPGIIHVVITATPTLTALIEAETTLSDTDLLAHIATCHAADPIPWHHVQQVVRISDPLCIERGEITPSHKVVRSAVTARYQAWLAAGGPAFRCL